MKNKGIITGMFTDRSSAEHAYNLLREKGYTDKEIHLVMSENTHKNYSSSDKVSTAESTLISFIASVSTLIPVPGIGLLMTGPLAASIAEDGIEGQSEEFIPALMGYGIPADYAKEYESGIKNGNIMIGFHARNEEDAHYFSSEWEKLKAGYIYRQGGINFRIP